MAMRKKGKRTGRSGRGEPTPRLALRAPSAPAPPGHPNLRDCALCGRPAATMESLIFQPDASLSERLGRYAGLAMVARAGLCSRHADVSTDTLCEAIERSYLRDDVLARAVPEEN